MSKKNTSSASSTPKAQAPVATTAPKAKVRVRTATPAPKSQAAEHQAKSTAAVSEAKAKTPKSPTPKTGTKFISVDTHLGRHMRVAEYQDYTLSINDTRKLTDTELCADWQRQFPNAVHFTPGHVLGVRRDFNRGIHSKAFTGAHDSKPWIVGENGVRSQGTPRTATKAAAKVASSTSAPSVVGKAVKTGRKVAA